MKLKDFIQPKKNFLYSLVLSTALFGACLSPIAGNHEEKNYHPSYSSYMKMSYKEVIKEISTPEEVSCYLTNYIKYEPSDLFFVRSFRRVHKEKKADCVEASIAAAALLGDNGYDLKYIWMFNNDNPEKGHAVYFYQDNKSKLYGTLGIFKQDNYFPIFFNLGEIAEFFCFENYIITKVDGSMIDNFFGVRR